MSTFFRNTPSNNTPSSENTSFNNTSSNHASNHTSSNNEKAVTIAISLLKHENPATIQTLKNLLTFIPNPNHVKDVLKTAVIELVHRFPKSALWLFQHPDVLEPDIQVRKIIAQELINKFCAWGYNSDDFHLTTDCRLEINETTKLSLLSHHFPPVDPDSLALIQTLLTQ